jgi:acyl dehydratase
MIVMNVSDDLAAKVGSEAVSDWQPMTQKIIDDFAEASGDRNPLHIDPDFARQTPYGSTIAHGYYFLAAAPSLLESLWQIDGFAFAVAYGSNRVRFPAALPVGTRYRLRLIVKGIDSVSGGVQITVELSFEGEGLEKPVCVSESVYRAYT